MDEGVLFTSILECVVSPLGDNLLDHVVYLKAEFLSHAVLSNKNGQFDTIMINTFLNRSVCL